MPLTIIVVIETWQQLYFITTARGKQFLWEIEKVLWGREVMVRKPPISFHIRSTKNIIYAFLPSKTYQLMRCIAWARLLGSLSKRYTIWSKMAKGKSPKPPLFQYQHSIVWKTYFKYQPSKGEGTKKAKTKLNIFMYKVDNNTYQRGWEKGRRWVKMKIVFTRWKCERMISNRYSPQFHTSSNP